MTWLYLALAGALEIVWAWAAGESDGFTKLGPTLLVIAVMPASFWLLARAMAVLPAGTTYAIWTAFGALGTAVLGIVALGEEAGPLRLVALVVVIAGVVLLRLAEAGGDDRGQSGSRQPPVGAASASASAGPHEPRA